MGCSCLSARPRRGNSGRATGPQEPPRARDLPENRCYAQRRGSNGLARARRSGIAHAAALTHVPLVGAARLLFLLRSIDTLAFRTGRNGGRLHREPPLVRTDCACVRAISPIVSRATSHRPGFARKISSGDPLLQEQQLLVFLHSCEAVARSRFEDGIDRPPVD
jgi:hypothetical protein